MATGARRGSPTPRPSPDPARRRPDVRRAILDATIDIVAASGFQALSIEEIARRAGVGKQTIYRWWPSKGAVLLDAFIERRVEERARFPVLELDTGDLASDIRRVVREQIRHLATASIDAPYRALTVAIQDDPDLAEAVREKLVRPSEEGVRDWLGAARDRGQLRADADLAVAAELLLGPVFYRWMLRTGPLDEAFADAVADAAVTALRA